MDYRYSVYGVALTSDLPFEFPSDPGDVQDAPRVRIARGCDADFAMARGSEPPNDAWFACHETADGSVYLRWSGLFEFHVDAAGTCVTYRALRDGDSAILQNFLFGQVLAFALIRQNVEPVHAAVVDVGGHAIAFLGDCSYGKSTLAGAFLRAGCRLVSDDLLVARESRGCVMARAGAGRIKLLPDSASAVLGDAASGVRLIPNADKRVFRLQGHMVQPSDVPLRAFVVMPTPAERDACQGIEIRAITGAQLFPELVKNTFVRYLEDGRRLRQNFSRNAQLASTVEGYRLMYPPGIERLSSVVDAVKTHLGHHSQRDFR
jgi:hypothetical protein